MIEIMTRENMSHCYEMTKKLWPYIDEVELREEVEIYLSSDKYISYMYKAEDDKYLGFIQLSIRNDYVEGSTSSPVAYIEGIYVDKNSRGLGIAKKLVEAAEDWGKSKNCKQLASDTEIENQLSIDFHTSMGFEEENRVVCFTKDI